MRRVLIVALVVTLGCSGTYSITMPYCPVSDSAKAKADSVPVGCLFANDSSYRR